MSPAICSHAAWRWWLCFFDVGTFVTYYLSSFVCRQCLFIVGKCTRPISFCLSVRNWLIIYATYNWVTFVRFVQEWWSGHFVLFVFLQIPFHRSAWKKKKKKMLYNYLSVTWRRKEWSIAMTFESWLLFFSSSSQPSRNAIAFVIFVRVRSSNL